MQGFHNYNGICRPFNRSTSFFALPRVMHYMLWLSLFLPEPRGSYERLYASSCLNTCPQLLFQNSWQIPFACLPPSFLIPLPGLWRDMDRALVVILDHVCPGDSSVGTAPGSWGRYSCLFCTELPTSTPVMQGKGKLLSHLFL